MRIGNWLGGTVIWAFAAAMGVAANAGTAEHVTSVPLGGALSGLSGEHHYGVYVPTRFGGDLKVTSTEGKVVDLKGPGGQPVVNGADVGFDHQGWYTFKIVGATKPYTVETSFVQVAQSAKKPWNFYYWPTKADSIHEPWAGGNARVDTTMVERRGDDEFLLSPGGYVAPGVDIIFAGQNGILETVPAPGDDATWFPNLYDDLEWLGPDKEHGGQVTRFKTPFALAQVRPALQLFGTPVGSRVQPEQGHLTLAGPLPGRRGRFHPFE